MWEESGVLNGLSFKTEGVCRTRRKHTDWQTKKQPIYWVRYTIKNRWRFERRKKQQEEVSEVPRWRHTRRMVQSQSTKGVVHANGSGDPLRRNGKPKRNEWLISTRGAANRVRDQVSETIQRRGTGAGVLNKAGDGDREPCALSK